VVQVVTVVLAVLPVTAAMAEPAVLPVTAAMAEPAVLPVTAAMAEPAVWAAPVVRSHWDGSGKARRPSVAAEAFARCRG
jgi:hypothetical protein